MAFSTSRVRDADMLSERIYRMLWYPSQPFISSRLATITIINERRPGDDARW
jgi:hypothetical protein